MPGNLPDLTAGIRDTLAEVYMVIIILSFILALVVALVVSNYTTRRLGQYPEAANTAGVTQPDVSTRTTLPCSIILRNSCATRPA